CRHGHTRASQTAWSGPLRQATPRGGDRAIRRGRARRDGRHGTRRAHREEGGLMAGYSSPRALEMAVKEAAKRSAMDTNRAIAGFYFHRLLCRVFSNPCSPFVLKGGLGALARTTDARYTRDIDLATNSLDIDAAVDELRALASKD